MTQPDPASIASAAALLSDLQGARANLKTAINALTLKRPVCDYAWRYYDGDHPTLWMTEKMGEMFKGMATRLQDNLCGLAVDSVLSRLEVTGWAPKAVLTVPGETASGDEENRRASDELNVAAAQAVWDANSLDLEQEDLYRHSLVSATGYVLVWPGEDGVPEAIPQDPRTIHIHYGSMRLSDRRWAAKVWYDYDTGFWRGNVYYAGEGGGQSRVVRLVVLAKSDPQRVPEAERFTLDPNDPGGFSGLPSTACPIVPFERRRNGKSRLYDLVPIQDKINKLAANKMVAAEFGAFRQRWILTTQDVPSAALRNAPDRALVLDPGLPDGQTRVGEFAITELSNYDGAIAAETEKFFTVAGLPRHMIVGNSASGLSGEFIRADEGPFVSLVDSYVARFTASWTDVMGLMGISAVPVWKDTEVSNDKGTAETVKTFTDAGVPLGLALGKYAGWSEEETAEAQAAASAAAQQAASAGALALSAFDQGQAPQNALPPL